MAKLDYPKMFAEAKAALESLHAAKANLEDKVSKVNADIDAATIIYNAIAPMVGEVPIPTLKEEAGDDIETLKAAGISLAVKSVLDHAVQEDHTASSVRDRLAQMGWDWEKYTSPLATVHTVLVRLAGSGAAKETTTKEGKKAFYSAKRVVPRAPASAKTSFTLPSPLGLGLSEEQMKVMAAFSMPAPSAAVSEFYKKIERQKK
jgi:hypothetical protein